jgi:S1-C subfamily serine protease
VRMVTGDVIHAINGTPVESMAGLRSTLDRLKTNSPVVLQIERGGHLMFVAFQLD